MISMRHALFVLFFIPFIAFAQSDDLRAQIRADLMSDPRTESLSPTELDALVAALASEAEETGEAEAYLDAKSAPVFSYDPPQIEEVNPYVAILTAPIVLAIIAFLIALSGVIFFLIRRRGESEAVAAPLPPA